MSWLNGLLKKKRSGAIMSTTTPRGENWVTIHHCVNCDHELTLHQKFNSQGICPFCCFLSKDSEVCLTDDIEELKKL